MIGPIEILDEKSNGGPVILIVFDCSLRFCMHEILFFFVEWFSLSKLFHTIVTVVLQQLIRMLLMLLLPVSH